MLSLFANCKHFMLLIDCCLLIDQANPVKHQISKTGIVEISTYILI